MGDAPGNRGRIRARRCAVQALYQWQLGGQQPDDIISEFVADRELVSVDLPYFKNLVTVVPQHFDELKSDLDTCLDREWLKLDPVERSVLLLGAYEMRFCPEMPYRVVISEGVELCKMFGTAEGHRYVNGVLDKLARNLRTTEIGLSQ